MKRCFGCMESYDDSMQKCPHCGYEEATMSQESFQLRPGLTLKGHYLLGKVLGYGGFGTTYLAWDETMRRTVAIKEYLPTVFATRGTERTMVTVYAGAKAEQFEKGRKQFLEEARKLARFTGHDSIVGVYDFFEENGTAYIVMEYLDGETLTEYLRRERRMTFEAALRVMVPVLKALQEVHKEGIIHRDIAPDNIRITKDGKVKLLDFGAAREASINHSHSLSVIYKPGYAPEEQYQSRGEQGPWTDVYALAATFYRMITGTKPAPALERLVSDTLVPPSELGVRISKNQETALLNALNVRKENRTQSAEAFLRELESAEDVVRVVADSGTEKNKKKKSGGGGKAILLVLLGLILLGGGAFFTCKALGVFGEKKQEIGTNEARVPSFVNSTWQEAQTLAKEANLVIEVSGVEYSTPDTSITRFASFASVWASCQVLFTKDGTLASLVPISCFFSPNTPSALQVKNAPPPNKIKPSSTSRIAFPPPPLFFFLFFSVPESATTRTTSSADSSSRKNASALWVRFSLRTFNAFNRAVS